MMKSALANIAGVAACTKNQCPYGAYIRNNVATVAPNNNWLLKSTIFLTNRLIEKNSSVQKLINEKISKTNFPLPKTIYDKFNIAK